ncbi:hypothetical protein [Vallitalea longa]|nr:hypothetical protein [Vallitalea longa]
MSYNINIKKVIKIDPKNASTINPIDYYMKNEKIGEEMIDKE